LEYLFFGCPGKITDVVLITINDHPCQVPSAITAIQALWYAGQKPIRGIGCLGGSCGACVFSYRIGKEPTVKTGLACQTLVEEGMQFTFAPQPVKPPAAYTLDDLLPTKEQLAKFYPEARRCTNCMACNWVCPQGIDARAMVRRSTAGDFQEPAERYTTCIMCGLCQTVCDEGIAPQRVGAFAHRAVARALAPPTELLARLEQIAGGAYDQEWAAVMRG
jgi:succinate dehydrogenase/fumarate reductase-like Fe-S protein